MAREAVLLRDRCDQLKAEVERLEAVRKNMHTVLDTLTAERDTLKRLQVQFRLSDKEVQTMLDQAQGKLKQ
jgi:hypothetical protein